MKKADINTIHKECLDYLLEYQIHHENFYFIPRKRNNKNRLEEGKYFIGNDEYLQITFWDGGDAKEKIHNIALVINSKLQTFLEISSRDKQERATYLNELTVVLSDELGRKFIDIKPDKWQWHYDENTQYLHALSDVVTLVKPVIDKYISMHPESGIKLASKEIDDEYVKKLPGYGLFIDAIQKAKKTGSIAAKASEYIMTFQHNELSNKLTSYLKHNGFTDVKTDENFVDIKAIDPYGKKIYFELKTATSVKLAVRQALGQLLEYNHYPNKNNADKLIIVTTSEPEKEDKQYLIGLRNVYNIPVYYQQFNMENGTLSNEF
ncbi:MAG: hypothetical protein ACYDEX_08165 [Mobilitalea sp.]